MKHIITTMALLVAGSFSVACQETPPEKGGTATEQKKPEDKGKTAETKPSASAAASGEAPKEGDTKAAKEGEAKEGEKKEGDKKEGEAKPEEKK
jgi:hypothetical protein